MRYFSIVLVVFLRCDAAPFYVEGERASGTRQVGEVGEVGVCRALNSWSQC